MDSRLRVLSAGDIIDEAIGLYRRNFRLFLSIGAVVLIPIGVIQLVLALLARDSTSNVLVISSALWLLLSLFFSMLSYVIIISAMAIAASDRWLDRPMTVRDAFGRIGDRIIPLIGLILLYGAVIAGLSITIVGFPFAIYLLIAWLLSIQVLLVEGVGIRAALSRSRFLVAGHWWRVVGIVVLLAIIQAVISAFFSLPAQILGFGSLFSDPTFADVSQLVVAVDAVSSTIGQIIVGPIAYCTYTLLYYDLRVRKEGLDIEYAARSLGLIDASTADQSA